METPKVTEQANKPPKVMTTPGQSPTFEQLQAAMRQAKQPEPEQPEVTDAPAANPEETPPAEGTPPKTRGKRTKPENSAGKEVKLPDEANKENIVTVLGKDYEIKGTKVKYFRNKTATAYRALASIPLDELFLIPDGGLVKGKSSDDILFNFLIAVFDDAAMVSIHYDNFTADQINQIIKIVGKVNGLEEKREELRKKAEAQAKP